MRPANTRTARQPVVVNRNYNRRIASHQCLNAMNLREAADYQAEFSQSGAKAVIASAEKFIEKAISILDSSE